MSTLVTPNLGFSLNEFQCSVQPHLDPNPTTRDLGHRTRDMRDSGSFRVSSFVTRDPTVGGVPTGLVRSGPRDVGFDLPRSGPRGT